MSPPWLAVRRLGLLLALATGALDAQAPATPLRLLYHTAWTNRDGAPSDVVGIAQSDDGYLWLGTTTGLFRFDGVRFERFASRSGERLPSGNISVLQAFPGGPVWVGYRFGGASAISGGRVVSYGERDGFPGGSAYDFVRDSGGTTWAATSVGIARLVDGKWRAVRREQGFDGTLPTSLFVDRRGTLWVAAREGVFARPRGAARFVRWAETLGYNNNGSIREDASGAVWGASYRLGTVRLTDALGRPPARAERIGPREALSLLLTADSSAWVLRFGDVARGHLGDAGATNAPGTSWQTLSVADGLSGGPVMAAFQDREGSIWLGTTAGIDRFRATKLTRLDTPVALLGPAIAPADDGALWLGSSAQPLLRVTRGISASAPATAGIECAYRDLDGAPWFGAGQVLWHRGAAGLTSEALPAGVAGGGIQAIARDREGTLWISVVHKRVFRRDHAGWAPAPAPPGMEHEPAIVAVADSAGRVWLGYTNGRLVLHERGSMRLFSAVHGLVVGNVTAVHVHGAHVWVGGENGLAWWDGARFHMVRTANPAGLSGISGIVETTRGELWLNSATGVIRVSAEEGDRLRRDSTYAVRDERFDYRDGITGVAPQIRPLPSAIQGTDGRLWFSMATAVVSVDPLKIARNTLAPPVHVTALDAAGVAYPLGAEVQLPAGTREVHLSYTAPSFVNPDRMRFRYRLAGSDPVWRDAGARREAFYTNLGPGSYRFQVAAANEDGVWSEDDEGVALVIPPTFVQSKVFLACLLAAALVAAWSLARMRSRRLVRAMEAQFEVTLAERTRIAQELHDTLLQGFAGVALQLHALGAQVVARAPDQAAALRRIIGHVEATLKDARHRVWDLRAPELDGQDLPAALGAAAREAFAGTAIAFTLHVEGERRRLPRLVEVAALRIVREALVNCARHARCSTVRLTLTVTPDLLHVALHDDGDGFAESDAEGARRSGHWGIVGMRERAEAVGGTLVISSAPGSGTTVRLALPIPASA